MAYQDYEGAAKCFEENVKLLNPQNDPIAWNLNNGLLQLAVGLRSDLHAMQQALARIGRALASR